MVPPKSWPVLLPEALLFVGYAATGSYTDLSGLHCHLRPSELLPETIWIPVLHSPTDLQSKEVVLSMTADAHLRWKDLEGF